MAKYDWTPIEALEQVSAALPDAGFAERYGIKPNLIHAISDLVSAWRKGGTPDEQEVFDSLLKARGAMPGAWPQGVPKELCEALDATIAKEDLAYLASLPRSTRVDSLYDDDSRFADALNRLIPDFEYPDYAHRTVGAVCATIAPQDKGAEANKGIGPIYVVGQRFDFKVGDPIVGNGYRGSVTTVCTGQLTGMVEVRLPGGSACLSASYPDCYPAIRDGVEVITDGRHVGSVLDVNAQFVVLDAGRGKCVALPVGKLEVLPNIGEKLDVQYRGEKVVVVEPKSKGNERGR